MSEKFNNPLTEKIAVFLRGIGLGVKAESISDATILPGVTIRQGTLIVDEAKLKFPGDLLHEAGHLAVLPPDRRTIDHCVGKKVYEEIAAIAWSHAALTKLNLEPSIVFHDEGYRGGSQSIIDNFINERYFGVPVLQWLGLTNEPKTGLPAGAVVYPQMIKWLTD